MNIILINENTGKDNKFILQNVKYSKIYQTIPFIYKENDMKIRHHAINWMRNLQNWKR